MAWGEKVPRELEDAVYAAARQVLGDEVLAPAALNRAIVDRSQRYTSDRDRLSDGGPGDLAARAVFFTIADAMKIAIPIAELRQRGALPTRQPMRVVDLGAGCGAMTLGLLASIDTALEVVAIDHDAKALAIAKLATEAFAETDVLARIAKAMAAPSRFSISTRTADVTRVELPPADLVVLGTVLNELPHELALAVVERALAAIADDGAVIIVEPALRDTSRALHAIRDAVITRGASVFAPCTRRTAPCTALENVNDWCHEDRPLVLSPRTAELAKRTHLRDTGMKFSYLVLRRQAHDLVPAGDAAWRVVSAPMPAKGKLELIGCNAHGRVTLRLLKRNRAAGNRPFERADRGDVIEVTAAPTDDRLEIAAETTVTLRSFDDGDDD
ncbi:MAG: class I SAM-dependent methyltransferase [Kofleriaceae bacterium]